MSKNQTHIEEEEEEKVLSRTTYNRACDGILIEAARLKREYPGQLHWKFYIIIQVRKPKPGYKPPDRPRYGDLTTRQKRNIKTLALLYGVTRTELENRFELCRRTIYRIIDEPIE